MQPLGNKTKIELGTLKKLIKSELSKLEKEISQTTDSTDQIHKSLWMKQIAESLRAFPQKDTFQKSSSITCKNIYSGIDEKIQLNSRMTLDENAALFDKKAAKIAEKAHVEAQKYQLLASRRETLVKAQETLHALIGANTSHEDIETTISTLKKRLSLPVAPPAGHTAEGENSKMSPFREFKANGYLILAGKTDEQNDELSTRYTSHNDLWFHAAHCAGSHVVIKREKGQPNPAQETINHAAAIAAWFSKARNSPSVDVHFTEGRFVHKRKGAPRGEVMLEKFRTLKIRPESPETLFTTS